MDNACPESASGALLEAEEIGEKLFKGNALRDGVAHPPVVVEEVVVVPECADRAHGSGLLSSARVVKA